MTGNTSATGGYLVPLTPIDDGDAFTDLLQGFVSGVSGIPGDLVRPRWQPMQPTQPPVTVNWAALGIVSQTPDDYPQRRHVGAVGNVPGYDVQTQAETIEVLCSFYGPAAKLSAEMLRSGSYVPQNREALLLRDVTVLDAGMVRQVPDLVNTQFINRCDVTIRFRRKLTITYPVLDLVSAGGTIDTNTGYADNWNAGS